jgi:acyl carrier protein
MVEIMAEQIAKILRLPASKVDVNRPLPDLGVDSLMALEIQMTIEKQFGVDVPSMEFVGLNTAHIAARVLAIAGIPTAADE